MRLILIGLGPFPCYYDYGSAQSVSQCNGVLILQLLIPDTLPDASQTPRAVLWSQFSLQLVMCALLLLLVM